MVKTVYKHDPNDVFLTTLPLVFMLYYFLLLLIVLHVHLMHQSYVWYHLIRCVSTVLYNLSETQRKEKSVVAGPTPRTGSIFQTVQGLIGTFYRGYPLLLAGQIFQSTLLQLNN